MHHQCSNHASIILPSSLDEKALAFLLDNGLRQKFPQICEHFERRRQEIKEAERRAVNEETISLRESWEVLREDCLFAVTASLQREALQTYP